MPLSAQSAINMHLGIGGIITKLGIEKRRNVKHAFKFMTPMVWLTRLLVGIGNVGAVDKDDSIQVSHCLPFQCRRKFGYFQSGVPGSARNSPPKCCDSKKEKRH